MQHFSQIVPRVCTALQCFSLLLWLLLLLLFILLITTIVIIVKVVVFVLAVIIDKGIGNGNSSLRNTRFADITRISGRKHTNIIL